MKSPALYPEKNSSPAAVHLNFSPILLKSLPIRTLLLFFQEAVSEAGTEYVGITWVYFNNSFLMPTPPPSLNFRVSSVLKSNLKVFLRLPVLKESNVKIPLI
jgi:hypothetical protein